MSVSYNIDINSSENVVYGSIKRVPARSNDLSTVSENISVHRKQLSQVI
jgi:hypothetical protein